MTISDFDGDARYRMSSCSECGVKERFNRLHHLNVREESGYSTSKRTTRTHYRHVKMRLCAQCYAKYKRAQAIRRSVLAIVGIIVLYLCFGGNDKANIPNTTPQEQTASSQNVPSTPQPSASSLSSAPPPRPDADDAGSQVHAPTVVPMPAPSAQPDEQPPVQVELMTVTDLANVREAPNNGRIVGQVWPGEPLVIAEESGKWAHVRKGPELIGWYSALC